MEGPLQKSRGHRCFFCGERFSNKGVLRKHVRSHKDKEWPCEVCTKSFVSSFSLKRHMLVHAGIRPHQCDICSATFTQKSTLDTHLRRMHSENPLFLFCQSCGKRKRSKSDRLCWLCSYRRKDGYNEEENKNIVIGHETENDEMTVDTRTNVTEEQRDTKYSTTSADNSNDSSETETYQKRELAFTCTVCSETVASAKDFQQHMLQHSKRKQFVCFVCNQSFQTNSCLQQHLVEHLEERPYTCRLCHHSFKYVSYLKKHIRLVHSRDCFKQCEYCEKVFTNMYRFKRHYLTHKLKNEYSCENCNEEFDNQDSLTLHKEKQCAVVNHECPFCRKTFTFTGDFKDHVSTHLPYNVA